MQLYHSLHFDLHPRELGKTMNPKNGAAKVIFSSHLVHFQSGLPTLKFTKYCAVPHVVTGKFMKIPRSLPKKIPLCLRESFHGRSQKPPNDTLTWRMGPALSKWLMIRGETKPVFTRQTPYLGGLLLGCPWKLVIS